MLHQFFGGFPEDLVEGSEQIVLTAGLVEEVHVVQIRGDQKFGYGFFEIGEGFHVEDSSD